MSARSFISKKYQVFSPAPREVWNDLVKDNDQVLIFQTPGWMDAITFEGHYKDCSRLYEFPRGKMILLPLVCTSGLAGWQIMLSSLPYGWGTGGTIFSSSFEQEEVCLMIDDLRLLNCFRLSIRPNPLAADLWSTLDPLFDASIEHVSHILDLSGGFDHFWMKTLSTATRTKIRKAEKSQLVIECIPGGKAVPTLYSLYLQWLDNRARERGIPRFISRLSGRWREPESKFLAVGRLLGEKCQVWIARLDQQPVAAAILLINRPHAVIWRSYSNKRLFNRLPVNYLLQKSLIEEACKSGCKYYHMEESGGVRSLMHFKEQFGAIGHPYKEYYLERFPFTSLQKGVLSIFRKMESLLSQRHT